jgi:polyhydroxybutyrate depolymerase
VRHRVRRVGSQPIFGAVLALCALLAVAVGIGLAFPAALTPFALDGARAAPPHPSTPLDHLDHPASATLPATGCGNLPPAPPGTSVTQTVGVGALDRSYLVHVPANYQRDAHTPLVLSFHAHGSSAAQQEQTTRLSRLADLHGFIVAYPQGVVGPDGLTGWNTYRAAKDPAVEDLLFVDRLLTRLQEILCVDAQRIYATGFSNGGGMTAVLACTYADRIAAFAPVAGDFYPLPQGCHPARPVPILEIHGTADAVIPYDGSAQLHYPPIAVWLTDWAVRDGCVGDPSITSLNGVVAQEWSECRDGVAILHDRLLNVGHTWPTLGARSSLAVRTSVHNGTFDATSAVWAFFERFTLPENQASASG